MPSVLNLSSAICAQMTGGTLKSLVLFYLFTDPSAEMGIQKNSQTYNVLVSFLLLSLHGKKCGQSLTQSD